MTIPKGTRNEVFLSRVLGETVITPEGHEIGKLQDLVMVPGERFPEVSHLLVLSDGRTLSLPWPRVNLFNQYIISAAGPVHNIPEHQKHEGDILLKRDILDRQIVDVNGAKVVRVNDLKLGTFKGRLCVFFVDVGFRGLLRRMGLEPVGNKVAAFLGRQLPHYVISWKYVQLLDTNLFRLTLTVARDQLKGIHPADLAHIIRDLPSGNVRAMIDSLDPVTAGEAIHELEPETRSRIMTQLTVGQASNIINEMDPDEAADVLGNLPEEKAQELLGLMDEKEADEIQELLGHEENTAGALMNSEFIAIPGNMIAEEALKVVRAKAGETDTIYYVYILDRDEHLEGVVSLKDLLVHDPWTMVASFMSSSVKSVRIDSKPYEVLEILAKYNFIAVPVMDDEGRMAGIITVEDVLELFIPTALRRKRHRA